jgi:hypothetical protein
MGTFLVMIGNGRADQSEVELQDALRLDSCAWTLLFVSLVPTSSLLQKSLFEFHNKC